MKIVAHRGYSAKYPELSALAFEKALALPIHGVECDVRFTRDGRVVVFHDPTLDRTTDRRGRVDKLDWADVRAAQLGQDQCPMLLDELLEMMQDHPEHHLYIETKHPSWGTDVLEEQVLLRLRYAGLAEDPRMHIISFSHQAMRTLARIAPDLDRWYLRRDWERRGNPADLLLSRPNGLGMSIERAKLRPRDIGAHDLPTYLWTVDRPADMQWAWVNGVDVLATNEPELALHTLEI